MIAMQQEHSWYGKIMVSITLIIVPLFLLFWLSGYNMSDDINEGGISISKPRDFTSKCNESTCIYNIDNIYGEIQFVTHDRSWSVGSKDLCLETPVSLIQPESCQTVYVFLDSKWTLKSITVNEMQFIVFNLR